MSDTSMEEAWEEDNMKEAPRDMRTSCPFPVACCGNKKMLLKTDDATGFQCVSFMTDSILNA